VPSILVPYPYAADDHQTKNAAIFDKAGAGIMIKETDLSPEELTLQVGRLVQDKEHHAKMQSAARTMAHPRAASAIADALEG
jgi:UDP-N-acetylglucosamine--N-acetylmuramyl-(pentapeptide) pyrophosphoryl-undecaprenol N-acetylglucosamine transferase